MGGEHGRERGGVSAEAQAVHKAAQLILQSNNTVAQKIVQMFSTL